MMPFSTIACSNSGTPPAETSSLSPRCRNPLPVRRRRGCTSCGPDDDLAGCREVRYITLHVHLGLLAVARCRQRNDPENTRADALGDRLDVPPLPAVSRPSKTTQTLRPLCTTHSWSLTSSTCSRASSFSLVFCFQLALSLCGLPGQLRHHPPHFSALVFIIFLRPATANSYFFKGRPFNKPPMFFTSL